MFMVTASYQTPRGKQYVSALLGYNNAWIALPICPLLMKRYLILCLLLLLVSLRLAAVWPVMRFPERALVVDSDDYIDLARSLLGTGQYADPHRPGLDLLRPPIYPLALAGGLVIGQDELRWVSLGQVFISFLIAALLYHLGIQAGSQKSGLLAAILYLANPNSAFWSLMVLTETLTALWLTLALTLVFHFWKSGKRLWLGGAGLCLGLAALTRPVILPLGMLWGAAILLLDWRIDRTRASLFKNLVVYGLGLALLVLPWQLRNYVAHSQFSLSEVGSSTLQNWMVANTLAQVEGISRSDASARIATSPDPFAYSLEVIRDHPIIFISEQVRGVARTLLGAEYGTWARVLSGREIHTTGILSAVLDERNISAAWGGLVAQAGNPWLWAGLYALIYDITLFALGFFGLVRLWKMDRQSTLFRVGVLALLSVIYLTIAPLGAGESRFRVPADPFLAWLAGCAWLPRQVKNTTADVPIRPNS